MDVAHVKVANAISVCYYHNLYCLCNTIVRTICYDIVAPRAIKSRLCEVGTDICICICTVGQCKRSGKARRPRTSARPERGSWENNAGENSRKVIEWRARCRKRPHITCGTSKNVPLIIVSASLAASVEISPSRHYLQCVDYRTRTLNISRAITLWRFRCFAMICLHRVDSYHILGDITLHVPFYYYK